jgi:hypothetical protein
MKQTVLRDSQPLSSVKTFPFVFHKAIFQYADHNSKSLIAVLSHKYTVQIDEKKGTFAKNIKKKKKR